ncbi:MAG: glycosyltransferase family 39 protein [Flavobacteriales bacterium]|nr:glycosyltransferase family 39 protein [Flavobacteriales bacterium]MCX7768399.1 glycosyltransferase family 39 protein [Flavobacteriales bacterium]MDW8409708.1 glycosyltransferase family 39 protein [Flavobacteriales bacterium]
MPERKVFFGILVFWLALCVWQAASTPLLTDEMYYATWARRPALYYFDHPPLIAWIVHVGQALFPGVWGLRLPALLFHVLTLQCVARLLLDRLSFFWFFALGAATLLFHAHSLLAVPDSPYLLGCAAFLFFLKQFFETESQSAALGMALSAAWTVTSKYHGWLFLALCLTPHLRFFWKRLRALAPALLLWAGLVIPVYVPAALGGFESLRLHLGGRHAAVQVPEFPLEFVGGWLLVSGVWIYPWALWTGIRDQAAGLSPSLRRSLLWVAVGFPLLIGALSFNAAVEANWAAPALLAALLLLASSPHFLRNSHKAIPTLIPLWGAVFLLRLGAGMAAEPLKRWRPLDFTSADQWIPHIRHSAAGLPVVFLNSYHLAASYTWYTGQPAYSLNNFNYRRNQYDLWQWDTLYWNNPVFLVAQYPFQGFQRIETGLGPLYGLPLPNLRVFPQLEVAWQNHRRFYAAGALVPITLVLTNHYEKPVAPSHVDSGLHVLVTFWRLGHRIDSLEQYLPLPPNLFPLPPGAQAAWQPLLRMPRCSGPYGIRFSLRQGALEGGLSRNSYKVWIP